MELKVVLPFDDDEQLEAFYKDERINPMILDTIRRLIYRSYRLSRLIKLGVPEEIIKTEERLLKSLVNYKVNEIIAILKQ
jgi:hypothetical protein